MTVKEVFDSDIDEVLNQGYAVLDIFGDHCGPCKAMAPYFDQVSSELAYIQFLKISSDRNPKTQKRFGISAVPTILFLHDGEVKEKHVGAMDDAMLRQHIAKLIYE